MPTAYDTSDIQVLEYPENIQRRPGMYVGGTGLDALHHLAYELVDNAVDEALAGACTHIGVEIHRDGSLTVTDDGRGIPTGMHPEKKRPTLELIFTELHAGGKFKEGSYSTSGGLHGVGVKATNALSEWLEVRVRRNGVIYFQRHEKGLPATPVQILDPATEKVVSQVGQKGETKAIRAHAHKNLGTGSTITFKPSPRFLDTTDFDFDALARRLQVIAFLLPGVTVEFTDGRKKKKRQKRFCYDGGLAEYVRWLNEGRRPIHRSPIEVTGEQNGVAVEIVLQWHTSVDDSEIVSFVNTIPTPDGGKHVAGFKSAITKAINQFAAEKKLAKGKAEANIRGSDTLAGLTAVLKLSMHDPHFTSQTKTQLASDHVQGIVHSIVYEGLLEQLRKKVSLGKTIVQQAQAAAQARVAASKARSLVIRRSVLDAADSGLPGKLADVSRGTPTEDTVLYIVEGDSAGGCFLGDTLIRLAWGETKTIRELAEDWERGIQHFGYASNGDGDVRIVPLDHPRLTRRDAELIEIELNNGERVRCTPDHLFRMRDRSYQRADQLQPGDSLMALKIRLTEKGESPGVGYEMVWMHGQQAWWHTHHLADLYNLRQGVYDRASGDVRHHSDFNKRNNDPRNIVRMPEDEHWRLHVQLASDVLRRLWQDPAYREQKIRQLSENAKKQWQNPEYRHYMSERAKIQRQDEELNARLLQGFREWFVALTPEEHAEYCERMRVYQEEYWSVEEHREQQAERVRQYFEDNPEARENLSRKALEQWQDEELLAWRSEETRKQWTDPAYAARHSEAVRQWWQEHPEHREKIIAARQRCWADEQQREQVLAALTEWRNSTTSEEKGRLISAGHRLKALQLLNAALKHEDVRGEYERLRRETAPTALRYDSLLHRYFDGDEAHMLEAGASFNVKVVAVRPLDERGDVYDITVGGYHNFALAAGPFVHNSAKQARDRRYHAILPLRGKPLNVEGVKLTRLLSNNEIKAIIAAIGGGVGADFHVEDMRYGGVAILVDADVDGDHIRTLLYTLFWRYMRPLVEAGRLYVAVAPLYLLRKGRQSRYAYSDRERDAILEKWGRNGVTIQRYKGLGEMNPGQLRETVFRVGDDGPFTDSLRRVTVEDVHHANQIIGTLMGSSARNRRSWLLERWREEENGENGNEE